MYKEIIYKGRDNTNDFVLKEKGEAVDLSGVTKMELVFSPSIVVNSIDNPEVFDWSKGAGALILAMGQISSLTKGVRYNPRLIVYDSENTFGIDWGFFPADVL